MRHLLASSFPTLKQFIKECKQMLLSFETGKEASSLQSFFPSFAKRRSGKAKMVHAAK